MDISHLPASSNVDDRRDSWVDHIVTLLKNPLRSQYMNDPKFNGKVPTTLQDFPMRETPFDTEGGALAQQAGYSDIQQGNPEMMPPNGMPPGAGAMPPGAPPMQPPGPVPGQPPLNVGQMPVDPQALAAMLMAQGGQPGMPPGGPPPGPPMMGPNGPVQGGMPPGGMPPRY